MRDKLLLAFLLLSLILSFIVFYEKRLVNKQKTQIEQLQQEITKQNVELKNCQETNQHLSQQLQIQQEEYSKRVSELLKKSQKPIKQIKINQDLPDDYKRIQNLIDQYIEAIK